MYYNAKCNAKTLKINRIKKITNHKHKVDFKRLIDTFNDYAIATAIRNLINCASLICICLLIISNSVWGKLLLKVIHCNIALLPKKVTFTYIT